MSIQKIGTDHLQAIAPGFVAAEHESSGLDGLFNDRDLTFVEFEINDLAGFRVLAGEVFLYSG